MKRIPLTPRLRLAAGLLLIPLVFFLLLPSRPTVERPVYDPYAEESEDGYRIHLSPQYEEGASRWGVKIPTFGDIGSGLGIKGRENVLITGGAGQLGQALLPRLTETYTVHILDVASRPETLPAEHVVYHRGSASDNDTIRTLLQATPFVGVIHFAGISMDEWCAPKADECLDINDATTRTLMEGIAALGSRKNGAPWVLMGSSADVYGASATDGLSNAVEDLKPETGIGKAMLQAEQTFAAALRPAGYEDASAGRMRGMILRFSHVYGYHHAIAIEESFVPSLMRSALSSLPIQYDSDAPSMDLLHVDDAVRGVLAAIKHLQDTPSNVVEHVNIVAGRRWSVQEVVDSVREITRSMSPVIDIGDHQSTVVLVAADYSASHAEALLGWVPSIALPEGMQRTITGVTEAQHAWVRTHLQNTCPTSALLPQGFKPRSHPADERNKALHKLDRCLVNLHFDHDGFLHHIKCDDGAHCEANAQYVDGYNWNASYWIVHATRSGERQARVMFEEEKGTGWLGLPQGLKAGDEARWSLVPESDALHATTFDIEAAEGSSMLKLRLPKSRHQVHAVSNVTDDSTWFSVEQGDKSYDMRVTVVCCPTEGEWPLLMDDHESADTRFGTTGQIPFNASRRTATCERAEASYKYTRSLLQSFEKDLEPSKRDMLPRAPKEMSHKPFNWAIGELPTCWNDCASPMVCVPTGSCRCVQAECPVRRENPIFTLRAALRRKTHVESTAASKLGVHIMHTVLVDDVARLSFEDALLPAARNYLAKHPEFIKVFVLDAPDQAEIEAQPCHKLQDRHCFSADSILYRGLRTLQVGTADEADLVVLPVYQQCKGVEFLIHPLQGLARDTVPGVRKGDKRVAAVLTHDWGICVHFAWEIWSARVKLNPQWIVDNTLVWSVMGDFDSPCYRPHQDVVVPARSCRSETLRQHFRVVDQIKPIRERPNLMTWAGTYWGTGKNERLRLTCPRGGADTKELIKGKGKQDNWESWNYMEDLNNARFCPQPRGIAGWSPRTNDAIYAGCIPVLIAEGSHYPFATFLDWTKFSVRIAPTDLDRIEQILAAIPLEQVERMQAYLALVREGFLYSSDENAEQEKDRRGPMWFALHEAGMRLRTMYPSNGDRLFGEMRAKAEGLP